MIFQFNDISHLNKGVWFTEILILTQHVSSYCLVKKKEKKWGYGPWHLTHTHWAHYLNYHCSTWQHQIMKCVLGICLAIMGQDFHTSSIHVPLGLANCVTVTTDGPNRITTKPMLRHLLKAIVHFCNKGRPTLLKCKDMYGSCKESTYFVRWTINHCIKKWQNIAFIFCCKLGWCRKVVN